MTSGQVEPGDDRTVVGAGLVEPSARVVGDRDGRAAERRCLGEPAGKRVTDENVIDELPASPIYAGEPFRLGDRCREIPQPVAITGIRSIEAGSAEFGSGWALEQLGGGGRRFVIEIAGDDERSKLTASVEDPCGVCSNRRAFDSTSVQCIGRVTDSLMLVSGANRPPGNVSSFDFKWQLITSTIPVERLTRTCSAGLPAVPIVVPLSST